MECPNCGKLIPSEAQICPFCLFVIKDWKSGKLMTDDQGVVIPPYAPEPIDSGPDLVSEEIPEIKTHTYQRRGKTVNSASPRRRSEIEPKQDIEINKEETAKKKLESKKDILSKKSKSDSNEKKSAVKENYATKQTHTFNRSPRADKIQEKAIRQKNYSELPENKVTLPVTDKRNRQEVSSVGQTKDKQDNQPITSPPVQDQPVSQPMTFQSEQPQQASQPVTPPPVQNQQLQIDAQSDALAAEINSSNSSFYGSEPDLNNDYYSDKPIDDITNISFENEPKNRSKHCKFFGILIGILVVLIISLIGVLLAHFFLRTSIGGKTVNKDAFANTQIKFTSPETKKTALSTPKKIKIKMTGQSKYDIPVKNIEILADGKPVNFKTDETNLAGNDELTGEITGIKKFTNNFSLRIYSDQKKNLYQSTSTKLIFPFDIAGTYWQVKFKSHINSPEKVLSIFFQSDKTYEETLETAKVNYADSKAVKKWENGAVSGTIVQGQGEDSSTRYLTNPQSFVETQYLSNYNKGKDPVYRLKYKNGSIPEDLNDYRHEIRLKNNQLYFFMPSASPQSKMQIFLFDEIEPRKFTAFNKFDSLEAVKQPGMTARPEVSSEIRKRILYNFVSQLNYELPVDKQAQMNTVFYDSPNGQETTGLITYLVDSKENNLMKFILYRNGRLNVYPLNSGFEVPKAYTINIYKDINSNDFKEFPDFKK